MSNDEVELTRLAVDGPGAREHGEGFVRWFWDAQNLCTCGPSWVAMRQLREALHRQGVAGGVKRADHDWNNDNFLLALVLESWELTEHGASPTGGWLTPQGIRLRDALDAVFFGQ